ncbi:MAG: hypothetical protein JXR10_07325 [Cyclobacteriaceae bacterium]
MIYFIKLISSYLILTLLVIQGALCQNKLEEGFKNPPPSAKARTWWHWMNGNISKQGITADLEAMKEVGIQEAQIFNIKLNEPIGPVSYLSESWLDHFEFAALEAKRLGLDLGFHNGAGWSSSGGPWITPEHAMQTVVFSETKISGGTEFNGKLTQPETKLGYYQDIAVLAFPQPSNDLKIDNLDYKSLSGRIRNHLAPEEKEVTPAAVINPSKILNLSEYMSEDGSIRWKAPPGEWIILRIGHTPVGKQNHPAPAIGHGLECDKMSKAAVEAHWQGGVQPILDKLGDLAGTVVNNCIIDSYEVGTTNWTKGFDESFKKLRGYDLTNYLPTLAGYYVSSGEVSERFLWDFRRTIGDLMAENYYGRFRELCHEHNLTFSVEPYWGPFDNMQVGATGDIVVCEFWSGNLAFFDSPKFVASIAKLNGNTIVGAESFTGIGGWTEHPASIKSIGDRAWAQGINRFIFHSYVHQPWEVGPGLTLSYHGLDFNRHNTWWKQSKAFLDYIARSQFLLQQGKSVADILVFTGESSPNNALLMPEIRALGFDYDLIGTNKLNTLSVKNGLIYTENGDSYQVMVLPETKWMRKETLDIFSKLAKSGALIIGEKPYKSPSLFNYPECDDQVLTQAEDLWESKLNQDQSAIDYLSNGKILPDFNLESGDLSSISQIHRKTGDTDIYFLANGLKERRRVVGRFRISGKQPELWYAETGEISIPGVWVENEDGTTSIPIELDPEESIFVVFRESASGAPHISNAKVSLTKPNGLPLSSLEIVKAEYGSFLPLGLQDITDIVASKIENNRLDILANRRLCGDCDPAPGYIKELRIEYMIGEETFYTYASEKEPLVIEVEGQGELKIVKAVFGKFERGIKEIPKFYPTFDVTQKVSSEIAKGNYQIKITDGLVDGEEVLGDRKELQITYKSNGVSYQRSVPKDGLLKLTQSTPESVLIQKNDQIQWITPYPGSVDYELSTRESKSIEISNVPESIILNDTWTATFLVSEDPIEDKYTAGLRSWSLSSIDQIKYYSGTASYKNHFDVSKRLMKDKNPLELDLGDVQVIAEVLVNDQFVGTLWKAPFRINIEDYVTAGSNRLEIRVTNLLPNRLIGDEQLPNDILYKGASIKEWPEWLLKDTPRTSGRSTLSGWKHWKKNDELQVSGLLGPVVIRPYKSVIIKE